MRRRCDFPVSGLDIGAAVKTVESMLNSRVIDTCWNWVSSMGGDYTTTWRSVRQRDQWRGRLSGAHVM